MKKRILAPSFLIAALIVVAVIQYTNSDRSLAENTTASKNTASSSIMPVSIQTVADSRTVMQTLTLPGMIVADQETIVTAGAAGIVATLPATLGQRVGSGATLATLDDMTGSLSTQDGYKSAAIQQAQLNVDIARKKYQQAKKDHDTNTRTDRDIARLQYESAQLTLTNLTDTHVVRAPFAGVITSVAVERGESVAAGQTLATVSATGRMRVRFFVDQAEYDRLALGQEVTLMPKTGDSVTVRISRRSPQAESATRRFAIEADVVGTQLAAGTLIDVQVVLTQTPEQTGNILLPLSALTTGQNEQYLFTESDGIAHKQVVTVRRILGEWAEVSTDLPDTTRIIIDGSKRVQEGSLVQVK
jgi:RND family efflux transporter MFP subunit